MKDVTRRAAASLALLCCAQVGEARAPSKAEAVVAAAKRATGGAAWDRPQGCYEEGTRANGDVVYKTWMDLRQYGMRVESRRGAATRAMGFNGRTSWQTDSAGKTSVRKDRDSLREAVVTAYLSNNGFFYPRRFPAALKYLGVSAHGGRRFDVIEITPAGGRAFDVWFDRETHLIGRVVDKNAAQPVTVEAGDYRRAGKFTIAFSLKVLGTANAVLDQGRVTLFRCDTDVSSMFDPPRER